ncbi:TRAP transporter substrate-binding protein DctP [Oceaniglobus trochenteri]|uniref:TRAP transporter substrate-binding protein DctP n=1 Tax=Oceaniglobus trochenteri TaxID=2763260 RepID=UPI001CFFFE58|nr:TRAP transporter substrate-binding protein DctP [Oceaniglobus trochenteri]
MKHTFLKTMTALAVGAMLSAAPLAAQERELTFSTIMVPEDPIAKGARLFSERLGELSDGKLKMTVYDSGQLFSQGAGGDALARGQVQLADTGMSSFSEQVPYSGMFISAYIFESVEHAERFWNSDVAKKIFDEIAQKANVRILNGMVYYGTRQLSLSKNVDRTVMTPEDLKGVKLRMANYPSWIALGEALGADPTPVAFNETYLAMQTGTVDGQDNGLTVSKAMGFVEQTKQLVLTDHLVWNLHYAINEQVWQSLSDEEKGWVQQAADEAHAYASDLIKQGEQSLLDEFKAMGIEIVEPDKEAFIEHARAYYESHPEITAQWDMEILQAIRDMAD